MASPKNAHEGSRYVYGVVPATVSAPERAGIAGASVRTIAVDDLAAIVSDLPGEELEAGSDELLAHSDVLGAALELGPVLPMRFGIVLPDDDAVREELLARFHDDLAYQLREVEGKVELHLRAVYDEDELMATVVRADPKVARLREQLRGQPPDATYYERIELGQLVAEAVERIRLQDEEGILGELVPLAIATHVDPVEHERVVTNASFLVENSAVDAFDAAVDDIGRRQHERMQFQYAGPLPAFSFVELPG